jgi:glycerol-3-phosphate dehydrogenase
MVRDLGRLADTTFDLVIVGAGFYGAIAAWDATLRGLSVAILDRRDFGAGTSFNNLKTLHGGLRSLQAMNVSQMRLFIRERRALARVAPHLVRPMPFVAPTYRNPARAATTMRVALTINDLVASDRNDGIDDPFLQLPPSDVLSRDECLRLNPVIDPSGVTGGARWHDYQMHNADRMTLSFVLSAVERGAVAVNYAEATAVLKENGRVSGIAVTDGVSGERIEVRARTVLNAAGPWAARWLSGQVMAAHPPAALSRAMNVVTRRVDVSQGCGGLARGRFLFLIPWRDVTLVGTSHDPHNGTADAVTVTPRELDTFMRDVADAFPRAGLTPADVRLVHRGLLPSVQSSGMHVRLLRESTVVDHRRDGAPGLISMFGVRYTTARHTAAAAIDAVFADRGVAAPPPSATEVTPVIGGDIGRREQLVDGAARASRSIPREVLTRLALTYGNKYGALVNRMEADPTLIASLGARCAVTRGEILHAVEHESAIALTDAVIRRTEAGSAGHPGDDALASAADVLARALGGDAARVTREIAETSAFYAISTS